MGFRSIVLESDSKVMVDSLDQKGTRKAETASSSNALISELRSNCTLRAVHVWREANSVVDWLATQSLKIGMDPEIYSEPPPGISSILYADYHGAFRPRSINR